MEPLPTIGEVMSLNMKPMSEFTRGSVGYFLTCSCNNPDIACKDKANGLHPWLCITNSKWADNLFALMDDKEEKKID
jgi:hypothetical protein